MEGPKNTGATTGGSVDQTSKFSVSYLGSMTMNRLYSQSMQPWVMAEIRRKMRDGLKEVYLEIQRDTLFVFPSDINSKESRTSFPLLEHHLAGLTRFAKLHQDPRCFAYLTRYQLNADFECHVFLANSEDIVSLKPFVLLCFILYWLVVSWFGAFMHFCYYFYIIILSLLYLYRATEKKRKKEKNNVQL